MGAKVALVVPGAVAVPWDPSKPVVPYKTAWKHAAASIRELLPEARRLGVKLGLENVWNWFLADPMAMKLFVDQFRSSQVGVYFDVGNCLINGYPEHWIEILGRRIVAVHVKNFSRGDCGGGLHGFGDDLLVGDVRLERRARGPAADQIRRTDHGGNAALLASAEPRLARRALARKTARQLRKLLTRRA